MTHPPELEQALAERLCETYGEDWGDKPAWLAVARKTLALMAKVRAVDIDCVQSEARDCGCSQRIEERIRLEPAVEVE